MEEGEGNWEEESRGRQGPAPRGEEGRSKGKDS